MARFLVVCALVVAACGLALAAVPCTSAGTPAGCDNTRWKPCGFYSNIHMPNSTLTYSNITVVKGVDTLCSNVQNGVHRGQQYVTQFTSQAGNCTEILITVGECWGVNPINGGSYGCQGRCGADCGSTTMCSNWAKDCLRHDACSWYYGAENGLSDPNCGDEYSIAMNDWFIDCLTTTTWCTLLNPTQSSLCCSTIPPPNDPGTC